MRKLGAFSGFFSDGVAFRRELQARELDGVVSCERRREDKGARRKKASSAPLFIGGGVVTGAVTTPPGSPTAQRHCGLRVAAQVRVYARHREGYKIIYTTRERDLRRREDPGSAGLLPSGSGQGAGP